MMTIYLFQSLEKVQNQMSGDYDLDTIKPVNTQPLKCVKGQYHLLVHVSVSPTLISTDSCSHPDKIWTKFSEKRIF